MIETWKDIPGYPLHQASNLGRIKSKARWVHRRHTKPMWKPERILKPQVLQHHDDLKPVAMTTRISPFGDGENKTVYIHHLVLLAFSGPRPAGMEACHWDGDPTNNAALNLRWDTQAANTADKKRHGMAKGPKHLVGERSPKAKLTNEQIAEILRTPNERGISDVFAKRFSVGRSAIYEVRRRYRIRPDKLKRMGIDNVAS